MVLLPWALDMGSTNQGLPTSFEGVTGFTRSRANSSHHSHKKTKAVKALETKRRYILGRDVMMNKVEVLCSIALIDSMEIVI